MDTKPTSPAMAAALCAIQKSADAALARHQRIEADPRRAWLAAACDKLRQREFGYGMAGGYAVFCNLGSSRNARHLRAGALLRARLHHLDGRPGAAKHELARAKAFRASEMLYRALEAGEGWACVSEADPVAVGATVIIRGDLAVITSKGEEFGRPVVDYRDAQGRKRWAYVSDVEGVK